MNPGPSEILLALARQLEFLKSGSALSNICTCDKRMFIPPMGMKASVASRDRFDRGTAVLH
jgi:hypothetical protein